MTQNIKHLIDEIHAAIERTPAAMQAIYQRHNSALVP
jgi:hypothetical protein